MKMIIRTLVVALLLAFQVQAGNIKDFFGMSQRFFSTYVENGLVDYQKIQKNAKQLDGLLKEIAEMKLENLSASEEKAFYINSYNLFVIKNILNYYPISSPLNEKGFFHSDSFKMAGKDITLNQLENELIRPKYNDARIHFVLVCGALGCPPLISEAYTADNVEKLLDRQTSAAMNNKEFTRWDGSKLELSEILKWYRGDFGDSDKEILAFINKYRTNKISGTPSFNYYSYNWNTNEKK